MHGRAVADIHFHEVGTMDAVADIVGCALLFDELGPDRVAASAVNTGYGQVQCAHGILPVPAPATARILRASLLRGGDQRELCTPTGAALLKFCAGLYRSSQDDYRKDRLRYGEKGFSGSQLRPGVLGTGK